MGKWISCDHKAKHGRHQKKTYNLSCPGFVLHPDCLLEKKDNNI